MMVTMRLRSALVVVLVSLALAPSLACPEPFYDDTIGVAGVPTEPGSLAGTFGLQSQAMDQAQTALGPIETGGITWSLVERTARDDDNAVYDERIRVCDVENFETAGLTTTIPRATLDAIPIGLSSLHIDHASGAYVRSAYREYWAVRDLDDEAPFPTDKSSPVFYDMDEDGEPGTTLLTSGLVVGEVYVAQRKTVEQEGVVRGLDLSFGLSKVKKEGLVLAATNDLLLTESPREPHKNPKNSWFAEVRLDDGAGCEAVLEARDTEVLPLRRPF
jgi:hypothetical protein